MEISWYIPNCHYGRDLSMFSREGESFDTVAIDPQTFVDTARLCEEIGFDTIWLGDHIMIPPEQGYDAPQGPAGTKLRADAPIYDPFPVMAYLAAITSKVKFGIGVIVVPYRNPVVQAKMLVTIDRLSGGRVIAGCGTGWLREEFETLQVPFELRGPLTDEYLDVMKAIWTQEYPSYAGQHYRLDGKSPSWPKPVNGTVPLYIGGWSGPALRRTVRIGDGILGAYASPEESRQLRDKLRGMFEEAGRDPVPYAAQARFFITDSPKAGDPACVGPPDKVAEDIMAFKEAGMEEVKFSPAPGPTREAVLEQLHRFRDEVKPQLDL